MSRRKTSGFTLIEVLIALVVLSFGLLGLATMQLNGLRNTNNAYYRTQASALANELVERIHANTNGSYQAAALPNCTVMPTNYCARAGSDAGGVCNAAQIATYDIFTVACGNRQGSSNAVGGINDLLPNGTLVVQDSAGAAACTANVQCSVTIGWNETGDDGAVNPQNVTVAFIP